MQYSVFVHTNHKQILGAKVAAYALRRNSSHLDDFDVHILHTQDYPWLWEFEGRKYLRGGSVWREWHYDDLQSFTPLRFAPPALMGYTGRALVIDPDVFALGDVWDLLSRDMGGKAIRCRMHGIVRRWAAKKRFASSVMLLDCAMLKHWDAERGFREMFAGARNYSKWINLMLEPRDSIGPMESEWNDFDRLRANTKMLHNTRRMTQPWKTGLPVDWLPAERFPLFPPIGWIMRLRRRWFGEYGLLGKYKSHPDSNQEKLFFGLLKECLQQGVVTEAFLRAEMARDHVRHDALDLVERTPDLGAPSISPHYG